MGSFMYLINEDEKICTEAFQCGASGNDIAIFSNNEKLALFINYCEENNLSMKAKHDGFFQCLPEDVNYKEIEDYLKSVIKN